MSNIDLSKRIKLSRKSFDQKLRNSELFLSQIYAKAKKWHNSTFFLFDNYLAI